MDDVGTRKKRVKRQWGHAFQSVVEAFRVAFGVT